MTLDTWGNNVSIKEEMRNKANTGFIWFKFTCCCFFYILYIYFLYMYFGISYIILSGVILYMNICKDLGVNLKILINTNKKQSEINKFKYN